MRLTKDEGPTTYITATEKGPERKSKTLTVYNATPAQVIDLLERTIASQQPEAASSDRPARKQKAAV